MRWFNNTQYPHPLREIIYRNNTIVFQNLIKFDHGKAAQAAFLFLPSRAGQQGGKDVKMHLKVLP